MRRTVTFIAVLVATVLAASFLPPDTSLQQVKKSGVLRVCMPRSYPPFVTDQGERPGLDVEIMRAVAQELDLRLFIAVNPAMGTTFDPRRWNVNRAQCQVLAGGTVGTTTTRSYLEVSAPYMVTGWAMVSESDLDMRSGTRVAVYSTNAGLDRLALSQVLRDRQVSIVVAQTIDQAEDMLASGAVDALILDAVLASQTSATHGWHFSWVAEDLSAFPVVLGFWKGDITLKRAIENALVQLGSSGRLDEIREAYGLSALWQEWRATR